MDIRRRWRTTVVLGLLFGLGSLVGAPDGQTQPSTATAEHLFREGKRLLAEGKLAAACSAFAGSLAKDPAVSTLLNLADCRERNQQFASAWGHFLDAERMTRNNVGLQEINQTALRRAALLEPRLSFLIINVSDESRVDGLTITSNGVNMSAAEWNTDLPIDGGTYRIEAKAPGFEPWATEVLVGPSNAKESINVPRFRQRPSLTKVDVRATSRRRLGQITLASGLTMVAGGLAIGYLAHRKWDSARTLCGRDLLCDSAADLQRGQALVDDARLRGDVSTVVIGAGVIATAVGAVLWRLGSQRDARPPRTVSLAPTVRDESVVLELRGTLP